VVKFLHERHQQGDAQPQASKVETQADDEGAENPPLSLVSGA